VAQDRSVLDPRRWQALWSRLGARGSSSRSFDRLRDAYEEPGRYYHTAEHIGECLELLDQSRHLARRPDEIEAALWFHDAVYQPGSSLNEAESASLASETLTSGSAPPEVASRVADLVLETRHLAPPTNPEAQLLCDIDLSILGREQSRFVQFEEQIRREYERVPEPLYRKARAEVLAAFLARPAIYQTEFFRDRYEATARSNLTGVLTKLRAT
jgi:predicted metal-dependent HD superfamily phosphohydrolase